MKLKLITFTAFSILVALIMAAIHNPFILSSGSDALDVNVLPEKYVQIVSFLFFISISILYIRADTKQRSLVLFPLLLISIILLTTNGHTFSISGKKHAVIDKWFLIPVQSLSIDPTKGFESTYYKDHGIGISIVQTDTSVFIFTGAGIFGIDGDSVISLLESFGAKDKSQLVVK